MFSHFVRSIILNSALRRLAKAGFIFGLLETHLFDFIFESCRFEARGELVFAGNPGLGIGIQSPMGSWFFESALNRDLGPIYSFDLQMHLKNIMC